MRRIIIDFLWISVAIALILGIVSYFFPSIGNSSGFVTTTVAAMSSGQMHGQRTGAEVSKGFAWRVAGGMTAASFALGTVVVLGLRAAGVPLFPEGAAPLSPGVWATIIGFVGLLTLLITRFAFRWGVKTGAKTSALRRERGN